MSTGAICVDAMWQNELKVELETESGNAILQKVGGSDGELILRLKEAMVGKSHLRSGVLGMNRINPIAHGIHSKAERSDGQARIRGVCIFLFLPLSLLLIPFTSQLIKRYLAPLASPEGLEVSKSRLISSILLMISPRRLDSLRVASCTFLKLPSTPYPTLPDRSTYGNASRSLGNDPDFKVETTSIGRRLSMFELYRLPRFSLRLRRRRRSARLLDILSWNRSESTFRAPTLTTSLEIY